MGGAVGRTRRIEAGGIARAGGAIAAAGAAAAFVGLVAGKSGPAIAMVVLVIPVVVALIFERPQLAFLMAAAAALVVPFSASPGSKEIAAFRLEGAVVVAATAVIYARSQRARAFHFVDLAVLAFVIASLTSCFITSPTTAGIKATVNWLLPLAFYVGARMLDGRHVFPVLWVISVGGAIGGMSAIYEILFAHKALFVSSDVYLWKSSPGTIFRPGGVYESPPGAATVLTIAAFCALPLISRYRGWLRYAAILCAAISTVGMIVTFTRAGLIGFGVGIVLYLALGGPKIGGLRSASGAALAAAAVVAFALLPVIKTSDWFHSAFVRPGNFSVRQSYWSLAEPLITDSPKHFILGHGVNSLNVAQPGFSSRSTISQDLGTRPILTQIGPHNQYIRTLLEQGFLGLSMVAVWLLGAPIAAMLRVRRLAPEARPVVMGLVAATIGLVVISFAGDGLRHAPTLAAVSLTTGLLVTLLTVRPRPQAGGRR